MSTFNHGGPAFPCDRIHDKDDRLVSHVGMTMRDYFAAAALQGLLATDAMDKGAKFASHEINEKAMAMACYAMADAMLRARKEKQ